MLAWLACGHGVGQVTAAGSAAERRELLAQQQRLSARFDRELAACGERFLVTDCTEGIHRQRRLALAPIRERLLQIDEAERQQRAAERREVLADKQQILDERMAAAQAAAAAASSASAPRERQRMLPPAAPLALPQDRERVQAEREQAAAARVREAQRRQAQAAERQARVARRLAERESRKGPVQPLPVPPAASTAR